VLVEHALHVSPRGIADVLRAEGHHAPQPGRPQAGDDAETGHRIRVVVHEHVVDRRHPRQQQLDGTQPGPLAGVLLGEHRTERADDLRAPLGEAQFRPDAGRERLGQMGVGVDEPGRDDARAVADHLGVGMLRPQR
jgi:hypothetical protein